MSQPRIVAAESASRPQLARIWALIVAVVLGWPVFSYTRGCWNDYWLLKDGREGTAVVTYPLWTGHNAVAYRYTVEGKQYRGESGRNYRDPRYMKVEAGEESVVYYSASHPWLSSLRRPEGVGAGLPVILLVLFLETAAVITIVNPDSRWALDFTGGKLLRGRIAHR